MITTSSHIIARNHPDYIKAFSEAFATIWGNTPLSGEIGNLSYFRALTCFLGSEEEDLADRRRLMYYYLSNDFAADKEDDTIVQLYNLIPIESHTPRILRNLCTLYSQAPTRKFSKDKGNTIDLYNEAKVDSAFRLAHKTAKFCNAALVMPVARDGKIEVDVLPPDLFRVRTDKNDFKKITELWIPISAVDEFGNTEYQFKVWTDTTFEIRDAENRVIERKLKDGSTVTVEPNRYGRIPGAMLQFAPSKTNVYGGGMWELLLAILDDNKLHFLADNDVVYTAFAVWLATNFGKANTRIAPNRMIKFDSVVTPDAGTLAPPSLENISGNGSFSNIEELRDSRYRRAARKEGLPESLVSDNPGLAASGTAMLVDRMQLNEIRGEDEGVFREFENTFYQLFALVANTDLFANIPDDARVSIDYVDVSKYVDPKVEIEAKRLQFEEGVIGAKAYLSSIIDDELITDDNSAIEFIRKNRALLRSLDSTNNDANNQPIDNTQTVDNNQQTAI